MENIRKVVDEVKEVQCFCFGHILRISLKRNQTSPPKSEDFEKAHDKANLPPRENDVV